MCAFKQSAFKQNLTTIFSGLLMDLGSEIRNRMRAGLVSGLLLAISFLISWIIWDFTDGKWIGEIVGFVIFSSGLFVYWHEADKISRIVTEVEKELSKAREQVMAGKFFCRYCGGENKSDAVFCEKCGKKLAET